MTPTFIPPLLLQAIINDDLDGFRTGAIPSDLCWYYLIKHSSINILNRYLSTREFRDKFGQAQRAKNWRVIRVLLDTVVAFPNRIQYLECAILDLQYLLTKGFPFIGYQPNPISTTSLQFHLTLGILPDKTSHLDDECHFLYHFSSRITPLWRCFHKYDNTRSRCQDCMIYDNVDDERYVDCYQDMTSDQYIPWICRLIADNRLGVWGSLDVLFFLIIHTKDPQLLKLWKNRGLRPSEELLSVAQQLVL
jgi:hypothetical protein